MHCLFGCFKVVFDSAKPEAPSIYCLCCMRGCLVVVLSTLDLLAAVNFGCQCVRASVGGLGGFFLGFG